MNARNGRNADHRPHRDGKTHGRIRRRLGAGIAVLSAAALIAFPAGVAAAPVMQITEAGAAVPGLSTPDDIAQTLLGPGATLDGPATINGSADAGLYGNHLRSFGRFTDGGADLGIDGGLVVTANAAAAGFAHGLLEQQIAVDRTDAELFDVVADADLCGVPSASDCVHNATSLEFSVRPTSRYIKFEYALAITEVGSWTPPTWGGAVSVFPDGFALFVGGRAVANNCAVVPQTSTYLTMNTAGIVPELGNGAANRAAAQANLDARITDPAAPNGFAYSTGDTGWIIRFLTVPLTCVADVNDAFTAGAPANIKIVVADVNDGAVSPAVFLQGGSVRFSDTPVPAPEPTPTAPSAPAAPRATAGDGTATITWDAPDDDGGAAITGYAVTAQPGGKTCTAAPPTATCTVAGLTNGTAHTFTVVATNSAGDSAASAASVATIPSAPPAPAPPAPAPPAPAPPAPAPPAPTSAAPAPAPAPPAAATPEVPPAVETRVASSLAPSVTRPVSGGTGQAATQMVHRIQFDQVGRYTFIYVDRASGRRITQLSGSRIGTRTITRRVTAPVLANRKVGTRLVINTRLAQRALAGTPGNVTLRIILRRPDGSLSAVTIAPDGTLT